MEISLIRSLILKFELFLNLDALRKNCHDDFFRHLNLNLYYENRS